ncbi:MAG: hypothetical protein JWN93_1889 [Hyphomicrobiales bacterium]|jgi:hypothetical protein|nr:hypothetical protein [Hyphomicrobiales bacterium]
MTMTFDSPHCAPAVARPRSARRVAFAALATFILLGPAPGQLFGAHSMFLREWVMFAGAGIGLPKGRFTLHRPDGALVLSPLEVVALPSFMTLPLERRIFEPADVKAFAARLCGDAGEGARLSFEGSVATFTGWRPLAVDDVCGGSAKAQFGEAGK